MLDSGGTVSPLWNDYMSLKTMSSDWQEQSKRPTQSTDGAEDTGCANACTEIVKKTIGEMKVHLLSAFILEME